MLDRLPSEILYDISRQLRASDVGRVSQLNRAFHAFCQSPQLWYDLFHEWYDALDGADRSKYDYARAVKARESAVRWFERPDRSSAFKLEALEGMIDIAETRAPVGTESKNDIWLALVDDDILGDSVRTRGDVLALEQGPIDDKTTRKRKTSQALAHLSVLRFESRPDERQLTMYREIVYENKFWLKDSSCGPFRGSGSAREVDWVKLEAIMHVMKANVQTGNDEWRTNIPSSGWQATRGSVQKGEDWSGISKTTWHGTYAFIDYRVYEHYNFHRSSRYTPTLEGEMEAIGNLMKLQLSLLAAGSDLPEPNQTIDLAMLDSDDEEDDEDFAPQSVLFDDDDEDDENSVDERSEATNTSERLSATEGVEVEDTPPTSPPEDATTTSIVPGDEHQPRRLSFSGSSEQELSFLGHFSPTPRGPTFRRAVRGTVTRLRDGQIHYRWVISYGGADQWLLNGVQVGGAGSEAGIFGCWSPAGDEMDPNGPFCYWPARTGDALD